jgi:DNA-binding IclR family transcriptional regulator
MPGALAKALVFDGTRRYRVPAAERALALLEFLAGENEPHGVSELSRSTGIPKSSCFSLLLTLEQAGYVTRNADDEWTLTLRLYQVGMRAARSVNALVLAKPILQQLVDRTALTAHLGMLEGSRVIYAEKVDAPGMVRFETYPGKPASLHLTAIGRAVASLLDERQLGRLLDGYEFVGGANCRLRSKTAFQRELGRVRAQGFAFENEEETAGVVCVAAPVRDTGSATVAAVGVTALAAQLRELTLERVSATVREAADELALLLGDRHPAGVVS